MKSNKQDTNMVSTSSVRRHASSKSHSQEEEHQSRQHLLHHHHSSLLSIMLFLLFLASCTAGVNAQRRNGSRTYPMLAAIPETTFRCFGRAAGYYADVETGCQVYHMCDTLEKQFSYLCPNYTLFNQKFMICDHWYMVNCTMSDTFFDLNDHIGEVPSKGNNAIDGRNNLGTRKSTILAPKPNGLQQLKNKVPVSQNKLQSTIKTTQVPSKLPTQSSFFTLPKRPLTTKSPKKTANRSSTSKTTKRFESSSQSPSKFIFTRPPFSPSSSKVSTMTATKPVSLSLSNSNTLKSTSSSNFGRSSTFTTRAFVSTTPHPLNPFSNSVFSRPSFSATTRKPSKESVFNHNTISTTTQPKATRTSLLNRNKPTSSTRKPFTSSFPGNAARSPGGSFSFSRMKIHDLTITRQELDGLVFKPNRANSFNLQNKSPGSSIAFTSSGEQFKSNLKAHPLVTTPHSKESDEVEDQTSQHSTQHILATPLRSLSAPSQSFGIQNPNKLLVPSPFSENVNSRTESITNIIEPPTARRKGTSPIKLSRKVVMNPQVVRAEIGQELPITPFTMKPTQFRPFGISEEVIPGVLHVSFQSARGNRDFFIPSSGLTLPEETLKTPSNSLADDLVVHDLDQDDNEEHPEHDSHMTMLFPGSSGTPVISALALNPKCPHCHPAFLRPGQCEPCVRIRR